jgi:hypothetical protein
VWEAGPVWLLLLLLLLTKTMWRFWMCVVLKDG